jgi:predicted O-methyltransferase YrrM
MLEQPSWMTLPAMQPYVQGLTIPAESGDPRVPHSCSTHNNLTVLAHYFANLNPQHTLEIGLGFGASAALLLSLHQHAGGLDRRHHAIDPFQKDLWGNAALLHLKHTGLAANFTFHDQFSALVLPKMVENSEQFSLIYIDGSHIFEDVFVDFYFCHRLLAIGGVLAFDDSSCAHIAKVLAFIRSNMASDYVEHSPYSITAPRVSWLKRIAARVLGRQQLTIFMKVAETKRNWATNLMPF